MSTAIQQSLGNLYYAIEKLESAIDKSASDKKKPRDLFSQDNAPAIAKKLDNAIGKIETLLKEGSNG